MAQTDPVTNYAELVGAGEIVAGPLVRLACERHLRDLDAGATRGLVWDIDAASRTMNFFRHVLRLNGGEFEGKPFILRPWQCFIIGSIFGWKKPDPESGKMVRRFRKAFIEIGKGNGKSPMAGGIGHYMLAADNYPRAEVYAAAAKKDQAMILFRDAVAMWRQSPLLSSKLEASGGPGREWNLAYVPKGSFFKPISSDNAQSGTRVHCGLLDEIHEHKNADMVNMMRAGTKGDPNALILEITNSGFDRTSVCWEEHEYSRRILERDPQILEGDADSWFAYVCGLDEGDDPLNDESCWIKANPNLGVSVSKAYIREEVAEAKGMPSKESSVRRLNFCQWTDAANPWMTADVWRSTQHKLCLGDYEGELCYGGLDLSSKRDLTSLVLTFPREGDRFKLFSWFWTPGDTVAERARESKAPYDVWIDGGHLEAPDGPVIDYQFVARQIADLSEMFAIKKIAFDPHKIDLLTPWLDDYGCDVELVMHSQGFRRMQSSQLWMHESIEQLEQMILEKRLLVNENPVLTWCVGNTVVVKDANENQKFDKRKSLGRIDGAVAMAMAIGLATANDTSGGPSVYEERGALVL